MDQTFEKRKKVIYDLLCDDLYVPMKIKEIAILLNIPKEQRGELAEVLDALVKDGKAEVSVKGKYMKATNKYITATINAHQRGFAFAEREGEEEDVFIPESELNGAMHKDIVQVAVSPRQT